MPLERSKKQIYLHLLKLTASLPLKNGGWETIRSFWDTAYFQVLLLLVSGRVQTINFVVPSRFIFMSIAFTQF